MINLYGTPLSHFSRKVRILLDLYGISYQFNEIGNVGEMSVAQFAGNPLMKIPTYVDDGEWLIESDQIASYIVRKYDPKDLYEVQTTNVRNLNARAVLNGIMQEEVKLILARRSGILTDQWAFFEKAKKAIEQGLKWLDENSDLFRPDKPRYLEFHLICLWEHLQYYDLLPLTYPSLMKVIKEAALNPLVQQSSPLNLKRKTP